MNLDDDLDFSLEGVEDISDTEGAELVETIVEKPVPAKGKGRKGKKGRPKKEVKEEEIEEEEEEEDEEKEERSPSEDHPYSKEELLAVFDDIIFKGEYRETVQIGRNAHVVFRSRTTDESMKISRILDGRNFKLVSTLEEHRVLLNLAFSLVEFVGRDLSNREPIPDRYKFIGNLPVAIIGSLAGEVAKFDQKVFLAMEEAKENF